MSSLSKLIRKTRRERDLTQSQLAEMAGVSRSLIAVIETGLGEPSLSTLKKIAQALNISTSDLSAALLIDNKQEATP